MIVDAPASVFTGPSPEGVIAGESAGAAFDFDKEHAPWGGDEEVGFVDGVVLGNEFKI